MQTFLNQFLWIRFCFADECLAKGTDPLEGNERNQYLCRTLIDFIFVVEKRNSRHDIKFRHRVFD